MALQATAIVIAVEDLARSKRFYGEGLGCKIEQDHPNFVSFNLGENSSSLGLYEREAAAAEAGELALAPPLEPDFRVGQLSLSYDAERDRVVVVATQLQAGEEEDPVELPDPLEVRLFVTRPQLRVLARQGSEVVARGRPLCPLCGNPLDPTGHICPAMNGHRPTAT
jgi:uncharacterized repeat protein (TIGR03847 family)